MVGVVRCKEVCVSCVKCYFFNDRELLVSLEIYVMCVNAKLVCCKFIHDIRKIACYIVNKLYNCTHALIILKYSIVRTR